MTGYLRDTTYEDALASMSEGIGKAEAAIQAHKDVRLLLGDYRIEIMRRRLMILAEILEERTDRKA